MKVNIIDPGSASVLVERKEQQDNVFDVIGVGCRAHEPIGACYVASYTQRSGHEVNVISPVSSKISIEEMLEDDPDLIAFSAMTFNYPLVQQAASRIKTVKPDIIIIIGGYHATCVPVKVSIEKQFDYVITREADQTLSDLINFLAGKRSPLKVRGIVYQNGRRIIDNFSRFDPNNNHLPFRTKEMMRNRKRYGLFCPAPSQQRAMALIVGSRGCYYNCKFCLSGEVFPADKSGNKVKFRQVGNIIDEINYCRKQFGTNCLFFVDLNFYGGNKERIRELCIELSKIKIKWYAMSRVDVEPEVFELMALGGCTKIGLGIESLVKPLKSGINMPIDKWRNLVKEKVKLLKEIGILSKGYFILGDKGDTRADIDNEAGLILRSGFDEIRLSFMLYSPGTSTYNMIKKNNGFVSDDLTLFSTNHPVIRLSDIEPTEMVRLRDQIYRDFYGSPKYAKQAASMIKRKPDFKQSYLEFNEVLIKALGSGISGIR